MGEGKAYDETGKLLEQRKKERKKERKKNILSLLGFRILE